MGIDSFPRAILHVDGDAFFASCEVSLNPKLRGKPVVTGKERGIASSMSYEAKSCGVTRGMIISDIRKICPEAIILPSDYETYSIFSHRMYSIVGRYSSSVDKYSIDECFTDLTGVSECLKMSYEDIVRQIKYDLDTELGMTFSVGLAPNKVLAKIASKWKKPSGLTLISVPAIKLFLKELPIGKVWGIGSNTSVYLQKIGIKTALDLAEKDEVWAIQNLDKPYQEIWWELQGKSIYGLDTEGKREYKSVQKTKTFTPASKDRSFIFSQLSKNVENACIKLRRHGLVTGYLSYFLKTQDFRYCGLNHKLPDHTSSPQHILSVIKKSFGKIYDSDVSYRATGVTLSGLVLEGNIQPDLFDMRKETSRFRSLFHHIDKVDRKFGKHTIYLGSSATALHGKQHKNDRGEVSKRISDLFKGENLRQRLSIPFMGEAS